MQAQTTDETRCWIWPADGRTAERGQGGSHITAASRVNLVLRQLL